MLPFVRILLAYDFKCQLLFEAPVQLFNAMSLEALQACIVAAERLKELRTSEGCPACQLQHCRHQTGEVL